MPEKKLMMTSAVFLKLLAVIRNHQIAGYLHSKVVLIEAAM